MSIAKSRGITSLIATLLGVLLVPELAQGATYSVRVRWTASAGPNVTGYRVTARPRTESSPLVVNAGLPAAGTDGSLAAVVSGLDGRTDYDVTVTAYASSGAESLPSNAIAVGYGQVAGRIDTDGDGLTDAVEDRNLNRMVDAGETSALSADTDGDNVGDATDQCQGTATGTPVNAPGCSCAEVTCGGGGGENTIWPSTTVPVRADGGPDSPVELGVKFRADVAGFITGVRFYKHALNTGTHVGNLWSSTGTLLATATFTAETASGWQQVTFSPPVAIAANTVYVASYYCPNGHYSEDLNYFATQGVDRPPLHAPANGVEGPNSVYAYGSPSSFPTQTWHAANYWVDVVFSPTAAGAITITTATLPAGTVGSAYTAPLVASGGTPPYTWTISSGALPSGLALSASTGVISGTPTASGTWSFTVQARAGTQTAAQALTIRIDPAAQSAQTIWPSTTVPVRADGGPDSPAELGVKFRADVAGFITGVRFYKHALNTGAHVGNLWSSTGTLLATATFTAETASGWQQVTFSPPVAIAANTVYVASYYCPNGHYSEDLNYFATQGVDRPPLHAPANGEAGPNSVYAYGSPSSFPTQTWHAANYWVDVVFSPTAPASLSAAATLSDTTAPGVAQRAGRIDPDGDRTGGTESEDSCPSPADEPSTSRRDSGVRRVTLDRSGTDYRLTAIGRFAIPDGLDLGTSGMTLVFEDGVHRRLLAVNLSGSDFEPTRTGWKARAGASTFERVAVRRRHGRVVVSLRGRLPLFALVDAAGAIAGPTDPALHWRVRFGAVCSDSLQLVCSEAAAGRRRCRGRAGAAGGSSRSARERR